MMHVPLRHSHALAEVDCFDIYPWRKIDDPFQSSPLATLSRASSVAGACLHKQGYDKAV